MQYFVWNHLLYSWLQISAKTRDYAGPHASVWALEDDAFEKIIQSVRRQNQLRKLVEDSEEWKRVQVLTNQLIVSMLYGFTGYIHQHCTAKDSNTLNLELSSPHFTKLWTKVVNVDLVNLTKSKMTDVKISAWRCFAALLDASNARRHTWREERLIYVDLLSGQTLVPLAPNAARDLCASILQNAIRPEEIVALSQAWIAENLTQVLSTFKSLLHNSMDQAQLLDLASPIVQSWSSICRAIASEYSTVPLFWPSSSVLTGAGHEKPALSQEMSHWLVEVCRPSQRQESAARSDFRHRCFLTFCEVAANILTPYTSYFAGELVR